MKIKKIFILLLIYCSIMSGYMLYNNHTKASEDGSVVIYEYASYENSEYSGADTGVISDDVTFPVTYSGTPKFSAYNDMVEHIRETMLERNTKDTFIYTGSLNGLSAKAVIADAISDAYSDDDNSAPCEGDYLYFSFGGYNFTLSIINYQITADITFRYHTTAEQEAAVTEKVNSLVDSWNADSMTEMQKVKLVHDYIVTNVEYDYTYSKYSAYNALIEGTSVCQGYALLTQRLFRELGLSARIISGKGNSENHAWNIVKIGEKYYNIDCTWDSNWSTYNSDTEKWNIDYHCYLLSDEDFVDHTRNEQYLTDEFYLSHPMYSLSYYEDNELNVSAGTYSFVSVSGGIVTNTSSDITILVMGNMLGSGAETVLNSIAKKGVDNTDGVRVVAADISKTSKSSVASEVNGISDNITACYDTTDSAKNTMFSLAGKAGIKNADGTVTIPVVLVIDTNNKIRYAYTGSAVSGGRLMNCVYNLVPGMRPAEPSAEPSAPVLPTVTPSIVPTVNPTAEPAASQAPTLPPDATSVPTNTPGEEGEVTPAPTNEPGEGSDVTPVPTNVPGEGSWETPAPTNEPGEGSGVTPAPTNAPGEGSGVTPAPTNAPGEGIGVTPAPTNPQGESGSVITTPTYIPGLEDGHVPSGISDNGKEAASTPSPSPVYNQSQTEAQTPKIGDLFTVSGLKYKITSVNGNYTVKCMGAAKKNIKKLVIPATVKYKSRSYKVTVINTGAFKNNKTIRSLTIGKNVVSIMNKAFYKCSNIKKITLKGKKLEYIGKKAFSVIKNKELLKKSGT